MQQELCSVGVVYKITEDCIACGACVPECPARAIQEGDPIYIIDSKKCTGCRGFFDQERCVFVCPVAACVPATSWAEDQKR